MAVERKLHTLECTKGFAEGRWVGTRLVGALNALGFSRGIRCGIAAQNLRVGVSAVTQPSIEDAVATQQNLGWLVVSGYARCVVARLKVKGALVDALNPDARKATKSSHARKSPNA